MMATTIRERSGPPSTDLVNHDASTGASRDGGLRPRGYPAGTTVPAVRRNRGEAVRFLQLTPYAQDSTRTVPSWYVISGSTWRPMRRRWSRHSPRTAAGVGNQLDQRAKPLIGGHVPSLRSRVAIHRYPLRVALSRCRFDSVSFSVPSLGQESRVNVREIWKA